MKLTVHSKVFRYTGLMLAILVWLANNSNPPNGRTGAPFDGHCNNCHSGGSYTGDVTISVSGSPSSIEANTLYNITLTMTPTSGNPVKGGYQLVVVDGSNANAGNLVNTNAQSGTEFSGGREYIEHRGGKTFGGNPISWDFNWTSPPTAAGNTIKFYFIGNFTNGGNNSAGDYAIANLETFTFTGPPPVSASISSTTNVTCNGGNNGSATVDATGGVTPYTYLWSNGQTGQTAVNLAAGNYTVTVTGASSSGSATAVATITQAPAITLSLSSSGTLSCINSSVTVTATAGGGNGGFSYAWSDGQTGYQAEFSAIGTYGVTATDGQGCTKTGTINVTGNLTPPNAVVAPGGTLTCQQPTLALSGVGSSSGPLYQYAWTTSDGHIVSGATTLTPLVNQPGTYTLTVTNTSNGCTAQAYTSVSSNINLPAVSATGGTITCANPSVLLSASSPDPVSYNWAGPNGFSSTEQYPTVLNAGVYTVTVVNTSNGCTNSTTATVAQNTTPPTLAVSGTGTITCIVSTVTLHAASNDNTASFLWTGPNNYQNTGANATVSSGGVYTVTATSANNGCSTSTSTTVNQNTTPPSLSATNGVLNCGILTDTLVASSNDNTAVFNWIGPGNFTHTGAAAVVSIGGTYTVTAISTANGCTSVTSAEVNQNTTPPVASAVSPEELTCADPVIQLDGTASSQGAQYTYSWTTANGNLVSGLTTLTPTVDAPGTYQLLVLNTNNLCSDTFTVFVLQDLPLNLQNGTITSVSCFGNSNGGAAVTANGGDGNYSYLWSTGDTTATVGGLAAGSYSATVSDGAGCTAVASVSITQPALLEANATATGESALGANDGSATAIPSGGTMPYSYTWSNGGNTPTIEQLAPGTYTVSVSDANGCTSVQTVTVNSFNCNLQSVISTSNVSCNGGSDGSISVLVSGAADPISYVWSNGATTASVSGLAAGVYTVSVSDANNCPLQLTATILQPPALNANATATGETALGANDGTATASPTGGTTPYTFTWSNGATSQTITGLAPGVYTVSVQDAAGCTKVQTVAVNGFNCQLSTNITTANASCFGAANGQATVVVNGGTLPFTYNWSNGASSATNSNLVAGIYMVSVLDANGCAVQAVATVGEPAPLALDSMLVNNVPCPESNSGSATIYISGGTAPYNFSASLENLPVGSYNVVASDANGCMLPVSFAVASTDQTPPVINCPTSITVCAGTVVDYPLPAVSDNCNLGGNGPELTAGLPSGSVFPLGSTEQTFQIKDASGNTALCSFAVTVVPPPTISLVTSTNDTDNAGTGAIDISVESGGEPFSFQWTGPNGFSAQTEDITGLHAGNYTLIVSNGVGCTATLGPITVDNTVGIQETPDWVYALRIVPNPASTTIRLSGISGEWTGGILYDRLGRNVREFSGAELNEPMDIRSIPNGMYFLIVRDIHGKQATLKWFKAE